MAEYFLAIDIGASGGRHILGHLSEGQLVTEEIYRFKNQIQSNGNNLIWNIDSLFNEVLEGLRRCGEAGKIPTALGIDTWGVDYVLLDENGKRIQDAIAYRDSRTDDIPDKVEQIISFEELYSHTGIQKQKFNTLYQLVSEKQGTLEIADTMLMIPDYLNYLLTGIKAQEYTNATTTGLVNAQSEDWDFEIIERLGLPRNIFQPIRMAGTELGGLKEQIAEKVGFDTKVYMSASHDTASAILSVPSPEKEALYISSGTWSLLGTEIHTPICTKEAMEYNLTNEGGYDSRFRFLKNIMGLWMIQSVRNEMVPDMDYQSISDAASDADIDSIVNVNDERFLAPSSMSREIKDYCNETNQKEPSSIAEYAKVIYRSLAHCYKDTVEEVERITGKRFTVLNIVGGGSKSDFLNQETASLIGRTVLAGPTEGTALGNLLVLLISTGRIKSLSEGRKIISQSVPIKQYEP